jgi:Lysozyme-like
MIFKRKKKKRFIPLFLLISFLGILWLYNNIINKTTEEQLMKYQPEISAELNKYHLTEFTPIILAIMYQESHGKGKDPMQSSESAGLKRNEINNPHDSIKQGVYHFIKMYKYGTKRHVDLDTIIQSYNMGPGYIDFVAQHGFKHSENLAKSYSEIQVKKSPSIYTCGKNKLNFRYPYCFGDFSYSQKVNDRIPTIKEILQKSVGDFSMEDEIYSMPRNTQSGN